MSSSSSLLSLFLASVAIASLTAVPLACGGSSDTIGPTGTSNPQNDASTSNSNPDATTPSGGDSSSPVGNDANTPPGNDSGNSSGGGDAAGLADGGIPVTPGIVSCGGVDCHVDQSTCCVSPDGGASCEQGAQIACPNNEATIHCLDSADCTSAQVCCGSYTISGLTAVATTACATGPCPTVQFCRTDAECVSGDPCIVQICQGQTLELCGLQTTYGCTAK